MEARLTAALAENEALRKRVAELEAERTKFTLTQTQISPFPPPSLLPPLTATPPSPRLPRGTALAPLRASMAAIVARTTTSDYEWGESGQTYAGQ